MRTNRVVIDIRPGREAVHLLGRTDRGIKVYLKTVPVVGPRTTKKDLKVALQAAIDLAYNPAD